MMRVVLLALLASPVAAYIRAATAVSGDVVQGAGKMTKGGKVGLYTVLLQVLNPNFGDLKQMVQCCGKSRPYASEIANLLNTNALHGDDIEQQVRDLYVGQGKCSDPGISALMDVGKPTCDYLYSFESKDFKEYSYSAMCVPSDVCAVDVAGATKGLKVGYGMVLQVLNRNYGDVHYAGEGPLTSCYDGMNMVNLANMSFRSVKPTYIELAKGFRIPTGKKEQFSFAGMKKLGLLEMMGKCEQKADTGVLYVFKNKFWSSKQNALNVTHFDMKLAEKRAAKHHPVLKMGKDQEVVVTKEMLSKDMVSKDIKLPEATPEEKMKQVTAIAEVTEEATAGVEEDEKMEVAKTAIEATQKNLAEEETPAMQLEDVDASAASVLMKKASDSMAMAGVVDKTISDLRKQGVATVAENPESGLEAPVSATPAGAAAAVPKMPLVQMVTEAPMAAPAGAAAAVPQSPLMVTEAPVAAAPAPVVATVAPAAAAPVVVTVAPAAAAPVVVTVAPAAAAPVVVTVAPAATAAAAASPESPEAAAALAAAAEAAALGAPAEAAEAAAEEPKAEPKEAATAAKESSTNDAKEDLTAPPPRPAAPVPEADASLRMAEDNEAAKG